MLDEFFHHHNSSLVFKGGEEYLSAKTLRFLGAIHAHLALTTLDLSGSRLHHDLHPLGNLSTLESLTADNCGLTDSHRLPALPSLINLSLNKNNLKDLDRLLVRLNVNKFRLAYLSLLANPLCPHPFLDGDEGSTCAYTSYRLRIIHELPNLRFLDCSNVKEAERRKSVRSGQISLTHVVTSYKEPLCVLHVDENLDSGKVPMEQRRISTTYEKRMSRHSGTNSEGNNSLISNRDL